MDAVKAMDGADPIADGERLNAVRASGLLDQPPQPAFDRLTRLAARLLGAPISLISLIDADRQFFVSQYGLSEPWASARQMTLSHSLCRHVVETGREIAVGDVRLDDRLQHGLAIRTLGVIGYVAVPITDASGHVLGAFCVIEQRPRIWNSTDRATLADLAAVATGEIALRRELDLRRQTEERLRILVSEIDHRVKNSLAVTRSLLEMQARASDDGFVREQLEEAAARVSTIALVHDRLYGHEATGIVNLADYLERLCTDLATSLGLHDARAILTLEIAAVPVPVDRVVSLGLIVTQLVTTAMKQREHAVAVRFVEDGPEHWLLTVGDAAAALTTVDAGRSTGLGNRLMTALTRQLGGEAATGEDGSARIRLPHAAFG